MKETAERYPTTCYQLGEIVFVPSYQGDGLFMSPGNLVWSELALSLGGATKTTEMLWKRAEQK